MSVGNISAAESAADIRTYAVTTLNEECGLLQWVSNTSALKSILEGGYARQGRRLYVCTALASIS